MLSDAAKAVFWNVLSRSPDDEPRDVFAVLDGARVRKLPGYLMEQETEFGCLFAEENDPVMLTRAPYLARVREKSGLLNWLLEDGWGRDWGIYVMAEPGTDIEGLLRDLRELQHARLPDRRVVLFRFFDPRVWRPFYPTCDATQLRLLFGRSIRAFACESEGGDAVLVDTAPEGNPRRESIALPL
jgi:hypothetical protein